MPPSIDCSPALWPFSVHVYALPGVAAQCLRLQDENGLDVGVLLAILWQACRGTAIDETAIDRLLATAAPVRERVLELRLLRRAVGSTRAQEPRWQETYEHLKAAEIAAERVELSVLEASLTAAPPDDARTASDFTFTPAGPQPAALALAALRRFAEKSGARSCDPQLLSLVEAVLPRASAARD